MALIDNPNALEETTEQLDNDVQGLVANGVDLASIEDAVGEDSGVQSAEQGTEADRAEVEAMFPVDPMEVPESYVQEIPVTWPVAPASEQAAYTALVNNAGDPASVYDAVLADLQRIGKSDALSEVESELQEQNLQEEINAAGALLTSEEFRNDPTLKAAVAKKLQETIEEVNGINIADEATIRMGDLAEVEATNDSDREVAIKSNAALDARFAQSNKIAGVVAEMGDSAFNWTAQTGLDLLGTLVSANDIVSYGKLLDHLHIEFSAVEYLVPGEMLKSVQDYASSIPIAERYELALSLQEFLTQNAGVLDANAVQAVTMMNAVFNTSIGGDPDDFNWDRWFANVGPTLDLLSIGAFSAIKNAVMTPLKMTTLGRMNRMTAANPKASAQMAESAMKDSKAAEMLGVDKPELLVKNATPKLADWGQAQSPAVVSKAIKNTEEELELLKEVAEVGDVIAASRGKSAAVKEQAELVAKSKGHEVWIGDTELVGEVGSPWRVAALVGKTEGYGFATEKAAREILKTVFNGQGTVLSRTNRIDGVEEVVKVGQEVEQATKQLIKDLKASKSTKLPRGEEKALRKELNTLRAEVKAQKPTATKGAAGTKASQQKKAKESIEVNRALEPLEREIAEIEARLDKSTQGARAEANISKLEQSLAQPAKKAEKGKPARKERGASKASGLDADVQAQLDKMTADKVVTAAKPAEESVEWFVKATTTGDIKFGDDAVQTSLFAQHGSWMFDADTKFAREISQLGNAVFDKWKYLEKEMLRDLDTFAKLNNKDQAALSKLLSIGSEEERLFTPAAIRREWGDRDATKAIEAYRDFRKAMDKAFTLENRIHRQGLAKDNMSHISGTDYDTFARVLTKDQAQGVQMAFDPIAKKIVPVNAKELYKGGQQLGQLKSTQIIDGVGTNFVKLDGVTVRQLPEVTLNYNPGWLPRTNRSNYFVTKEIEIVVDGVKQKRSSTVGVAHSLGEASKKVASLQESAEEGVKFAQKHDRELTSSGGDFAESLHDLYSTSGGLFYGKRGDRLKDSKGMSSAVTDPLEAAVKAVSRISRDSTMKPYIDDMKSRFVATYSDILSEKGVFPASVDGIHKAGAIGDPDVVKAKALYRHIEILDGLSTGAGFRKNAILVADYSERNLGKVGGVLAQGVRSVSDFNPVSWIRARNFELNLATSPLAQIVVQPSQVLNMIALGPTTFVTDFRRGRLISKLAGKRADVVYSAEQMAPLAKSLGMSTEELVQDVRAFRRSGGGSAVSSHETARDAAKPLSRSLSGGAIGKATSAATAVPKKVVGVLGKGFERGEEINIGVHWQVAKRRWMKNNPDSSPYTPEASFAIAGEARSLSLSMTQTGDLAYQRGVWAIPSQYFAVQHKQLMLMTTNKALTKAERLKVASVQLAAWGPAGLGMGWLLSDAAEEADLDLSGGVGKVIEAGLLEWTINEMLSVVFSTDVDLDLSGRFAAAGGLNDNAVTMVAEALRDGEMADLWKAILGPTASNLNRFAFAADTISTIYDTESPNFQDYGVGRDALLSVFSSYNAATQARIYKSGGFWTDKAGRKLFTPNDVEIWAKGLLSINPSKLDSFYTITGDKRKREEEIRDVVDEYYSHINRLTNKYLEDTEGLTGGGVEELRVNYEQQVRVHNAIIRTHAEDAPEIMQALQRKINNNINKLGFDELTRGLQKMTVQKGSSSDAKSIIKNAVDAGFLQQSEVDVYENFVSTMLGDK